MQDYAALFNRAGYSALVVDSLTPRYEVELCTQRSGSRRVTQSNRRLDALGAVAYLAERADVDPRRIGLVGWSNGGSTVLAATNLRHRDVAAALVQPAFAVAFYPGCEADLKRGYEAVAPLLMLVGQADDWTAAAPCRALAREAGGPAAGDRGLCRRVPRLRQRPAGAAEEGRAGRRQSRPGGSRRRQCRGLAGVAGPAAGVHRPPSSAVIDAIVVTLGRPPHRHRGAGKHRRRADELAPADAFAEHQRAGDERDDRRDEGIEAGAKRAPDAQQAQVDRVADDRAEQRDREQRRDQLRRRAGRERSPPVTVSKVALRAASATTPTIACAVVSCSGASVCSSGRDSTAPRQ